MGRLEYRLGNALISHLGQGLGYALDHFSSGPLQFPPDHSAGPGAEDGKRRMRVLDCLLDGSDGSGAGILVAGSKADYKNSWFVVHDKILL